MKITTRIALEIFPSEVWKAIRDEWPMTKLRWRNRFSPVQKRRVDALRQLREVRLHLGCGRRVMPEWTNVDCFAAEGIAFECDFRDALPFADGAVQMLYTEHVLEHLEEENALALLRECHRVMAPGAVIRLGIPDLEIFIRAYLSGDSEFFRHASGIGSPSRPLDTPARVINQMARMGGHHRFAWDFETMKSAFESAGFTQVNKGRAGFSRHDGLCLDDPEHAFETLYVEAVKA